MLTVEPGTFAVRAIGYVESPLVDTRSAPRQGDEGSPSAVLALLDAMAEGLCGLDVGEEIFVLTWFHLARRDVLVLHPRGDPTRPLQGVLSTRAPDRPNPIGLHRVRITGRSGTRFEVRDLEAVDGTPIIDIKPVLDRSTAR